LIIVLVVVVAAVVDGKRRVEIYKAIRTHVLWMDDDVGGESQ